MEEYNSSVPNSKNLFVTVNGIFVCIGWDYL